MGKLSISNKVREKIGKISPGVIFGLSDFKEIKNSQAVILELSRLARSGVIHRLSKGKYYRVKVTKFGDIGPNEESIIEQVLKESGGYIAGLEILNKMGVTTQVPSQILIRGARSNRKIKIGNLSIRLVKQGNPDAHRARRQLVNLVEVARLIKKTPDGDIGISIQKITLGLKELSENDVEELINIIKNERPYVRAIFGAIMQGLGLPAAEVIRRTLNPVTTYKIGVDERILPNRRAWKII